VTPLPTKPDAAAIVAFMSGLESEPWLGQARTWWPKCVFRTEHLEAAVEVLNSGRLLSRAAAEVAGCIRFDSASPGVISGTADQWKRYVRLYFRPRAPTQYVNEGFRPASHYQYGAHCPVPIVFVFDSHAVLARGDSEFSIGNLARGARTGCTAEFLRSIPFHDVYHDSWFDPGERDRIVFHRHAEVIVPDVMDLSALRFVGCRSQAEYETLLHMLAPEARTTWSSRIGLGIRANLHYRRWNFADQVAMSNDQIVFTFNSSCTTRGPFRVEVNLTDAQSNAYRYVTDGDLDQTLRMNLRSVRAPESYTVSLTLDGRIAYQRRYDAATSLL
jgi:hypothetical protein